jgi:hypothetical protein
MLREAKIILPGDGQNQAIRWDGFALDARAMDKDSAAAFEKLGRLGPWCLQNQSIKEKPSCPATKPMW